MHPFLRSRLKRWRGLKFEIPIEDTGRLRLESRSGTECLALIPCKGCGEHFLFTEVDLFEAVVEQKEVRGVRVVPGGTQVDRDSWVWCARCRDRVQAEVDARRRLID
jgi:hypothetical protein